MSLAAAWHEFMPRSFEAFRTYSKLDFRHDLVSGLTVGIVALPLAMAFAIASGVTPDRGLFTAVVAGFLISLLGGSRYQIGGPTGAFVVVLYGVVERHGYEGLVVATIMAGLLLIALGFARLGGIIKYIPFPVITGFTAGIAVIIFSSQVKDFLGLSMEKVPSDFVEKWAAYAHALPTVHLPTLGVALLTLGTIIAIRRFKPRIPAAIVGVTLATAVVTLLGLDVATIGSKFGGIPSTLPTPTVPDVTFAMIKDLIPDALAIAFLAGIESLLSAVIADGMTGDRHKSNTELIGQGVANIAAVLFGGIAATGAIARTATNIKTGARTPVSGMIHAVFLLLFMLVLAPVASLIPLCSLAAVLFVVSWDMSEKEKFYTLLKAPRSDVLVLLMTFVLTVLIDLTVAVQVGIVLAALLFMKRMSDVTNIRALHALADDEPDDTPLAHVKTPAGVEIFDISGPFFFGVADKMKTAMLRVDTPPKVLILRLNRVPVVDATGLHALSDLNKSCKRTHTTLLLAGVRPSVRAAFHRIGLEADIGPAHIFGGLEKALEKARTLI